MSWCGHDWSGHRGHEGHKRASVWNFKKGLSSGHAYVCTCVLVCVCMCVSFGGDNLMNTN